VDVFLAHLLEDDMSASEMNDDVEAGAFTDQLSDEALDREEGDKYCATCGCAAASP
jgi:hypothetical protein